MVREYGAKLIFVYRDLPDWFMSYKKSTGTVPDHIHVSEYDWIQTKFDCEIANIGTYTMLFNIIELFLEDVSS